MKKELKNKKNLLLVIIFYMIISVGVYLYLKDSFHLMICWNIFLALIPLFISSYLRSYHERLRKVNLVILSIIWLPFFPNATYVMTDFIHIQGSVFYQRGASVIYLENFAIWMKLIHIIFGSILGLILGMKSLSEMQDISLKYLARKASNILLIIIFILTGYATYIGRFLRFNSWDILLPIRFFQKLIDNLNLFTLSFSLIYSVLVASLYILYRIVIRNNQNN